MKKIKFIYIIMTLILLGCACSGNSDGSGESIIDQDDNTSLDESFNVNGLLEDAVNSNIIPAVNILIEEASKLNLSVSTFVEIPTEGNLIAAQNQWKTTALAYADIHAFNIGEVRDKFLNLAIYNWPTLPSAIENIIADNDEVNDELLSKFSSQVKNLAAIEYLLFAESNSSLLEKYITSQKRRNYLSLSAEYTKEQSERLLTIWKEPTNYANTFLTNESTGIKGSFNMYYNGLYNLIDTGKVTKIGKPAGLENSTNTDPEITQAFYSHTSLEILKRNIVSIQNVYFKDNGLGLSDYAFSIAKNNTLNNAVEAKINEVISAIEAIPTNLYTAIVTNHDEVKLLHEKLEELGVLFSVDLRSLLSITITSTDNDGD